MSCNYLPITRRYTAINKWAVLLALVHSSSDLPKVFYFSGISGFAPYYSGVTASACTDLSIMSFDTHCFYLFNFVLL